MSAHLSRRALVTGCLLLAAGCAVDLTGENSCDAITGASSTAVTRCTEPNRVARCEPYVGGPTHDATWTMDGCDVEWRCPEGRVGFVCTGSASAFDCVCRRDDVDTVAFGWTGDPCTRAGTAIAVAQDTCGWDVP